MKRVFLPLFVALLALTACGADNKASDNDNITEDTLTIESMELAGDNCPVGGMKIEEGLDTDSSGVLEEDEISRTYYDCYDSYYYNYGANPDFVFDQTMYVGAVNPDDTDSWYSFAMEGSYPTTAADIDLLSTAAGTFTAHVSFSPDMSGIQATESCPLIANNPQVTVTQSGTVSLDEQSFPVCVIAGRFTNDTTLSNQVIWSLEDQVLVGTGNALQSTFTAFDTTVLTIAEGTVFMNQAASSLVITRGSRIEAVGTADHPIVMSGIATPDNFGGDQEWGGLILQGYGYNNTCGSYYDDSSLCNRIGEGDSGYFGGINNADSSGSLKYVIITEAGQEVSNGDELNGIGFMAVGYGTTIDYVQIHGNKDDGVEFFGGAVDAKHLVLTGNQDDDIDWDEGYVGNIQYALVIKYQNQDRSSNHVFELDTQGDAAESAYQESNPTIANITAIVDLDTATYGSGALGDGIHLKMGSEGRFFNSVLLGDMENCVFIEDDTVESTVADDNNGVIDSVFQNIYCNATNTLENNSTYALNSLNTDTSPTLTNTLAYPVSNVPAVAISSAEMSDSSGRIPIAW
ncbi:DUF7151 family protein [Oceanobacter mangrovi]|uniref:DUF7151 family protein n=1 Tax=Oceanobacter mangrovi TaxID=2862510 RepID=UPI001C8D01CD|nr:hypothetical protein [Oceanobacter mangrovi]